MVGLQMFSEVVTTRSIMWTLTNWDATYRPDQLTASAMGTAAIRAKFPKRL